MSKAIEQILGWAPLTGLIQTTTTGIANPLPEKFNSIITPTYGDAGRYTQVNGTRKTAKIAQYGSPAKRRELKDVSSKDVKLLHTSEQIHLDLKVMNLLRGYTTYERDQGRSEVKRQIAEFRQLFDNLEVAARLMALAKGVIYFDSNGNLLPSSSGALETISMGMNATTNQGVGQDTDGSTALITASWGIASTDIPLMLRRLRKCARRRTGYPLKYALYGENVPTYIAKNDYVKDWFTRHPDKRSQYLDTGELPDGMMGFTWVPAYEAFYEDNDSAFQDIWSPDLVVFTPEPDETWWTNMQGTVPVPIDFNVARDPEATKDKFKDVQGMFAYGVPCMNPAGTFDVNSGNTWLSLIKVPNAVYQLDTTP